MTLQMLVENRGDVSPRPRAKARQFDPKPALRSGELVLASLRDLPTQAYYRYLPRDLDRTSPPLVSIHGVSRNAREHAIAGRTLAQKLRRALIAPLFSREHCRGFQLLGLDGRGERADVLLDRIVHEVALAAGFQPGAIDLFGFSGGAQFAHRYALFHPARVRRLAVASAGWYTTPDPALAFPYGLARGPQAMPSADLNALLEIPQLVCVGSADSSRDRQVRSEPALDDRQGRTRVERAFSYTAEIYRAASLRGLRPRVRLAVIDGASHDFRDCMKRGLTEKLLDWFGARCPIDSFDTRNVHES